MELGSYFLFLQEQIKDIIIIIGDRQCLRVQHSLRLPPRRPVRAVRGGHVRARPRVPRVPRQLRLGARRLRPRRLPLPRWLLRPAFLSVA